MADEESKRVSQMSEKEEIGMEDVDVNDANIADTDMVETDVIDAEPEEPDDEGEDYTPLNTSEDSEKQRSYKEYKKLVKDINYQNELLERIKSQIQELRQKSCPTSSERKDLKKLYEWLKLEMDKLTTLIETAIRLQNFGSRRRYKELPLVTTFDEENNMEPIVNTCATMQVQTNRQCGSQWRASGGDSSELDRNCSCTRGTTERRRNEKQLSDCEEKKLLQEIFETLKECNRHKNSSQSQCKQQSRSPCKKNQSMDSIKSKINSMQQTICKLKEELCNRECKKAISSSDNNRETCASNPPVDPLLLCLNKKGKTENLKKLKDNYLYLLTEFSKKDDELKQLKNKLKNSCEKCGNLGDGSILKGDGTTADESELQLLRNRIDEMNEEQIEFKCLMREQSLQLEEYRNKYLSAQQKVEEQCALLDKLNMNNKRIEKQINIEIKEIRAKFQEKLNDLLKFPRLLENEQIKLAQTCKEKEQIEKKLIVVCKELKNLKSKSQKNNDEGTKAELQACQQELCQVKKNLEEIQNQRDMFCEQLRTTIEDLSTLRSESAKIIARTKERAEQMKQQQQDQIDRLEKQLAQCRATACLSVSDRESVIREMQGQLNTLSYSFDAAQKQIKTLRNHIAYMSNENCFPSKC